MGPATITLLETKPRFVAQRICVHSITLNSKKMEESVGTLLGGMTANRVCRMSFRAMAMGSACRSRSSRTRCFHPDE